MMQKNRTRHNQHISSPFETAGISCSICQSNNTASITTSMTYAMRSDGLLLNEPLAKVHCFNCGVLLGRNNQPEQAYLRSSGNSEFDLKRHQAVANGIANLLETSSKQSILSTLCKSDARVLEIGGANFATALALKKLKPHLQITSIEPSPEQVPETNDIDIIIDTFSTKHFKHKFDIIFSNNVIEHIADTRAFLKQCREMIEPSGCLIVCCPAHTPASNELLFSDHLYHFTPQSLALCCQAVGLELVAQQVAGWDTLTQVYLLRPTTGGQYQLEEPKPTQLFQVRRRLLTEWSKQDKLLKSQLDASRPLLLFGAGEFSQLIRTYLPKTYAKVSAITVDSVLGARQFDKPIIEFGQLRVTNQQILIGLNPSVRPAVEQKLSAAGFNQSQIIVPTV